MGKGNIEGAKGTSSKMEAQFEKQLTKIGLAISQIEDYNLEQLQQSLERVNDAIKNPEAFGVIENELGNMAIGRINVKTTALPILLERKKLILDRINLLSGQEKITNLRELVGKKVQDKDIRSRLISEIDRLESEAQKLREQSSKVEEELAIEKLKKDAEVAKLEVFERRSRVFLTFLERESVATLIGGILMIVITLAQIFVIFLKIPPSDILNNAFLLILGYFFGQTVSKGTERTM